MRSKAASHAALGLTVALLIATLLVDTTAQGPSTPAPNDTVKTLVGRLDLEKYKATIKGLTQFGDRRQGTERNRAAVDWIEAQLKSYGCPTERIKYTYNPPPPPGGSARRPRRRPQSPRHCQRRGPTQRRAARAIAASRGRPASTTIPTRSPTRSCASSTAEPTTPGPREEVYCTKVGTTRPDEMYIVGAHMDGHGWGEAANDNGSGTALVMELARIFSMPDVQTERTIRFALWNNEETGLNGAPRLRRSARGAAGQGESAGIGPLSRAEVARHDPARHDDVGPRHAARRRHAAVPSSGPRPTSTSSSSPPPSCADEAMKLAFLFRDANEKYATDYPAAVGPPHDQHRLDAVHGHRAGDQPARERARHADGRRLEPARGISRPTSSRRSPTRISARA